MPRLLRNTTSTKTNTPKVHGDAGKVEVFGCLLLCWVCVQSQLGVCGREGGRVCLQGSDAAPQTWQLCVRPLTVLKWGDEAQGTKVGGHKRSHVHTHTRTHTQVKYRQQNLLVFQAPALAKDLPKRDHRLSEEEVQPHDCLVHYG